MAETNETGSDAIDEIAPIKKLVEETESTVRGILMGTVRIGLADAVDDSLDEIEATVRDLGYTTPASGAACYDRPPLPHADSDNSFKAMSPFAVFCYDVNDEDAPGAEGLEVGKFYIHVPKGCLTVNGKESEFEDILDGSDCVLLKGISNNDEAQGDSSDSSSEVIIAKVRCVPKSEGMEIKTKFKVESGGGDNDIQERDEDEKWEPGEKRYNFIVGVFGSSYEQICESAVHIDDTERLAAFRVEGKDKRWKLYCPPMAFTYGEKEPSVIVPAPAEGGWIDLPYSFEDGEIFANITIEEEAESGKFYCVPKMEILDSSDGYPAPPIRQGDVTRKIVLPVAKIAKGEVTQVMLGAVHMGSSGHDPNVDDLSIDWREDDGSGSSQSSSASDEGDEVKKLEIKGWKTQQSTTSSLVATLGLPEKAAEGESGGGGAISAAPGSDKQIIIRNGPDGALEYMDLGAVDINEITGQTVGDGTLTIKQGSSTLGTFTANQATNTEVTIPAPVTPNDGVLSITVGNNSPVTFTANQATNTSVTIPEGVALTDTDPSDVVLSTGTASAGISTEAARADHVHKLPSTVKIKQSPVADPSASGTATAFIDSISQNANGEITVTKKNVDIPAAQVQSDWSVTDSTSKAFIKNKPTIPAAQVNANWNATSGVAQILNKPTLAAVATSGSYNDLTNKPAMMTGSVTVVTNIYWYGDALYFTTSTIDFDNKTIRANGGTKLADTVTHQSEHT